MARPHTTITSNRPDVQRAAPWQWLKANLFNTWYNSLLTIVAVWLVYVVISNLLAWALYTARWEVIPANLRLFLIGTYPKEAVWRIWVALWSIALLAGLSGGIWGGQLLRAVTALGMVDLVALFFPLTATSRTWMLAVLLTLGAGLAVGRKVKPFRTWIMGAWVFSVPWTVILLKGFTSKGAFAVVGTTQWGGLMLTLILAVIGIAASFPLGILLALGRRSSLSIISGICTAGIEIVRGLPLVTILFMAQVMVPIFLSDFRIDKVIRAIIGMTVFTSAYMAENVRGGLQSIPRGQFEAAAALGLNGFFTMLLIILPQALRAVIPAIVGQFISLFKDTSLVAIIGLLDLLGIGRSIIANPDWLGLQPEVYLFIAFVYWIFSYTMSHSSRRLEKALGVGER